MGKSVRGKNIKKSGWRGTCPVCKRTGVKLLWSAKIGDEKEVNACKRCGK